MKVPETLKKKKEKQGFLTLIRPERTYRNGHCSQFVCRVACICRSRLRGVRNRWVFTADDNGPTNCVQRAVFGQTVSVNSVPAGPTIVHIIVGSRDSANVSVLQTMLHRIAKYNCTEFNVVGPVFFSF